MATVNCWQYEYTAKDGYLGPGESREFWYGSYPWYGDAVAVSAHPGLVHRHDAATMEVTRVLSYWDRRDGPHWLVVTVKNVGPARANVQVSLGDITP